MNCYVAPQSLVDGADSNSRRVWEEVKDVMPDPSGAPNLSTPGTIENKGYRSFFFQFELLDDPSTIDVALWTYDRISGKWSRNAEFASMGTANFSFSSSFTGVEVTYDVAPDFLYLQLISTSPAPPLTLGVNAWGKGTTEGENL